MRKENHSGIMLLAVFIVLAAAFFYACEPADAATGKIKTYYTNHSLASGIMAYQKRCQVVSYHLGTTVKYSKKREVGEVRNTSGKTVSRSLNFSRSTSRTISMSVSAAIPKPVLKSDVSATIGGSLTFNTTTTIGVTGKVPPRSKRSVYLQYKTTYDKYKYVVTVQQKNIRGKWVSLGKAQVKLNTVTTKIPVLVM